jgi:hypothetical protein
MKDKKLNLNKKTLTILKTKVKAGARVQFTEDACDIQL